MTIPFRSKGAQHPTKKGCQMGLFPTKSPSGMRKQMNSAKKVLGDLSQASSDSSRRDDESDLKREIDRLRNEAVIKMGEYQEIKVALENSEKMRIQLVEENKALQQGKASAEEVLRQARLELSSRKLETSGEKCRAWLKQVEGRSTVIAATDDREEGILPRSNSVLGDLTADNSLGGAQGDGHSCADLRCGSSWNSYCGHKENEGSTSHQGDIPASCSNGDRINYQDSSLASLAEENQRLKRERDQLLSDCEARLNAVERGCEYRVLEISDRKKEKEEELASLIQEKDALLSLVSRMESDKLTVQEDLKSARKKLEQKDKDIKKLKFDHDQKMREWKDRVNEVVVQKALVSKSSVEIENKAKKSNEEAQRLSDDILHHKRNIETLGSKIESLEHDKTDLQKALEREKQSQKNMLGEKHREIQSLESQVADLKAEVESIQAQCMQTKKTCQKVETEAKSKADGFEEGALKAKSEAIEYSEQLLDCRARVNALESENSMIACERDELVGRIMELQNDLHAKQLECSNILGRLKRKEAFESELRALQEVMKNKELEAERVAEKVKRMEKGLGDGTRSRDLLKGKIKELETRLTEQEASRKLLEGKVAKLKERGLHLTAEWKGAEEKRINTEKTLQESERTCSVKDVQLAEVKRTLDKTLSTVEGLGRECKVANGECQRLRNELKELQDELSRAFSELESRDSNVTSLRARASSLEKEIENLSDGKAQIEAALKDARQQVVTREEKISCVEGILRKCKGELAECNRALQRQIEHTESVRQEIDSKTETVARMEKSEAESNALVESLRQEIQKLHKEVARESSIARQLETSETTHVLERRKMENELHELSKFVKLQEAELLGLRSRRVRGPGFVEELLSDQNEQKVLGAKLNSLGKKLRLQLGLPLYPTPVQIVQSLHKVVRHLNDQAPTRRVQDSASSRRGQPEHLSAEDKDDSGSGMSEHHAQLGRSMMTLHSVAHKKRESAQLTKGKKGNHLSLQQRKSTRGVHPLRHPQKLVLLR